MEGNGCYEVTFWWTPPEKNVIGQSPVVATAKSMQRYVDMLNMFNMRKHVKIRFAHF